jgi:DNA-binding winged helix-turn-helix (wHTH) protein
MESVKAIPRDNSSIIRDRSSRAAAEATLEFGRFRVLLRERQLIADGAPIELGTRALDLLLVLLEADGALVTKEELFSRVWPGIVVAEENLKVQIAALRKALGEDRDFIRTEFGRGYRFTAAVRSTAAWGACQGPRQRWHRQNRGLRPQWISWRQPHQQRGPRVSNCSLNLLDIDL